MDDTIKKEMTTGEDIDEDVLKDDENDNADDDEWLKDTEADDAPITKPLTDEEVQTARNDSSQESTNTVASENVTPTVIQQHTNSPKIVSGFVVSLGYLRDTRKEAVLNKLKKTKYADDLKVTDDSEYVIGPYELRANAVKVRKTLTLRGIKGRIKAYQ
jgi:hypothetical protein